MPRNDDTELVPRSRPPREWFVGALTALFLLLASGLARAGNSPEPGGLDLAQGERSPTVWALIVGVSRYDSPDISSLQYACADATDLAGVLEREAGLDSDHIILMTSDATGDARPTRDNVRNRLGDLKDRVGQGDALILFFSGHGAEVDGSSYLLTCDASGEDVQDVQNTSISVSEVRDVLQQTPASRLLVIIDACRNDPFRAKGLWTASNLDSTNLVRDLELRPLVNARRQSNNDLDLAANLYACKSGQRSYEGMEGHGYLTHFLLEGLRGAAVNGGRVTLESLLAYITRHVAEAVKRREGKEQIPWCETAGSQNPSDWVLTQPTGQALSPEMGPASPPPAGVAAASPPPSTSPTAPPPVITVTNPPADATTTSSAVALVAEVNSRTPLSDLSVSVSDTIVPRSATLHGKKVVVRSTVPLAEGDNEVVVSATTSSGETATATIKIRRETKTQPTSRPSSGQSPLAQVLGLLLGIAGLMVMFKGVLR